jgi:hypothetical protein
MIPTANRAELGHDPREARLSSLWRGSNSLIRLKLPLQAIDNQSVTIIEWLFPAREDFDAQAQHHVS